MASEKDAIALLKEDHKKVKELFDEFEKAKTTSEKNQIMNQAVMELKIHATIEEEIFYPGIRDEMEGDIMNEADEEHHVARVLIAELDNKVNDDHREAKFTVLAENVRHHIKEEERNMMPKAKKTSVDMDALGRQLAARKSELMAGDVPSDKEHEMVQNANGSTDSPATAAEKRIHAA